MLIEVLGFLERHWAKVGLFAAVFKDVLGLPGYMEDVETWELSWWPAIQKFAETYLSFASKDMSVAGAEIPLDWQIILALFFTVFIVLDIGVFRQFKEKLCRLITGDRTISRKEAIKLIRASCWGKQEIDRLVERSCTYQFDVMDIVYGKNLEYSLPNKDSVTRDFCYWALEQFCKETKVKNTRCLSCDALQRWLNVKWKSH